MSDIIVIGGGASGIVAAIKAKNEKNRVRVLERNSTPLKKLLMTGNGKCNYLNEVYSIHNYQSQDIEIVNQIIKNQNIEMANNFFDDLGIIPKIKNGYYYPYSNQATTIQKALIEEANNKGVEFVYNALVTKIEKENNKFLLTTTEKTYTCDKVVLATGSKAYPKTGSDGMGYEFLKQFHHTIIKPLPALVQLESNISFGKEWDGVRCDVRMELFEDQEYKAYEEGELQCTSYGISGICTFNLSNIITRGLEEGKQEVIKINFVPFIETLLTPWLDTFSKKHSNKTIKNLLEGILNYKLVNIILKESHINKDSYYQDLSNEEKRILCKNLRSFPIEITSTKDYSSSQICNGGVKLTEIKEDTMESKLIDGLYITGELLDMNGNCGGYNLTLCWISGLLAGTSLGEEK